MAGAKEKYQETKERVSGELAAIKDLIAEHETAAEAEGVNWTHQGDLSYVLGQLIEIGQFLGDRSSI